MAQTTVVAVLGLGEAGARIASDLVRGGVEVHAYDPVVLTTPDGVVRVDAAAQAVARSSLVLALTTAATATTAAESALPGLPAHSLYADLNTASPALKRDLASLVEREGHTFADVALLGPVPDRGIGTPALVAGSGARAFADALQPLGMPVEVVSDTAGDAAGRKLLRSVFMKGVAASVLESLRAAEAAGQAPWLEAEIASVLGDALLRRLVEGSRLHAARRMDELAAAGDLLRELGVEARVTSASRSVLAELADAATAGTASATERPA